MDGTNYLHSVGYRVFLGPGIVLLQERACSLVVEKWKNTSCKSTIQCKWNVGDRGEIITAIHFYSMF